MQSDGQPGSGLLRLAVQLISREKWLLLTFLLGIAMTSHANQSHRYECPAFLVDGHSKHAFLNVELFDTPPENKVSLMGGQIKNGTEWGISKNSDIYMVCGYKGTDKTILVHAPGVSICRATTPPPTAYCD